MKASLLLGGILLSTLTWADGATARAEFERFREEQITAERAKERPNFREMNARIAAKARELIKDVNPESTPVDGALDYATVFLSAGNPAGAQRLAARVLESKPNQSRRNQAHFVLVDVFSSSFNLREIFNNLNPVRPTNKAEAVELAQAVGGLGEYLVPTNDAVLVQDLIFRSGTFLRSSYFNGEAEQTELANLRAGLLSARIGVLRSVGQDKRALAILNQSLATVPEGFVRRGLLSTKTQLELIGSEAPSLNMDRKYGEFTSLADMKGKVVLLDFFAHWCGPCIAAFPDLRKFLEEKQSDGLAIVGVTTYYGYVGADRNLTPEAEFAKMADFKSKHNMTWPIIFSSSDENFNNYGVSGIPHVVVVDRDGKVRKIEIGFSPELFAKFRKEVEEILKQPAASNR